ncbi:MAG: GH25 family lysozyme, partial [Pseudonocardiaceae bacterium]
VDVHPQFQAGLNIEEVRREGFDFLAAKVSQGTTTYDSMDWLRRAKACGLLAIAYHYLEPGNEIAQAKVFAGQLRAAGVPGMVDAEYPLPNGDTLSMAGIRGFLTACRSLGASVPLIYLPFWYWGRMGSPDLTGLPGLWASSYVTGTGYASTLAESLTPRFWAPYGGLPVAVLQFTDRGLVAGQHIDVDTFPGTRDDLVMLLAAAARPLVAHTRKEPTVDQLPPTAAPTDPNSDPATWPQRNYDVGWNVVGGWEGGAAFSFGVQDLGGRSVDRTRGYLSLASWIMPGGQLVPVDPVFTAAGHGQPVAAHTLTKEYAAPAGCVGVTLNYAAPGGAYVAVGRSGS